MHLILFILFATLCLAGALRLLFEPQPLESALSLVVVMSSLAVLYLMLGAEFLAAAQMIVYAGAIMVLFTFVVMLLNAGREEKSSASRVAARVGFPALAVLLSLLATILLRLPSGGVARLGEGLTNQRGSSNLEQIGALLFTRLLLPFELTSVLILVAILGAVALAERGNKEEEEEASALEAGKERR